MSVGNNKLRSIVYFIFYPNVQFSFGAACDGNCDGLFCGLVSDLGQSRPLWLCGKYC